MQRRINGRSAPPPSAALTQELHDIVENDHYPFSLRIRCQCMLAAALLLLAASARADDIVAVYAAYWAGLPAGEIQIRLHDGAAAYHDEIEIRTTGLPGRAQSPLRTYPAAMPAMPATLPSTGTEASPASSSSMKAQITSAASSLG